MAPAVVNSRFTCGRERNIHREVFLWQHKESIN
jgi:hypothetical protein